MHQTPYPRFLPSGEGGLLIELSGSIDEAINRKVRSLYLSIKDQPGIIDCIPAFASLLVTFDPLCTDHEAVKRSALSLLSSLDTSACEEEKIVHVIPVLYDGEDLSFVAANSGLSEEEVIALHSSRDYLICMLGFLPGFAYLGGLDERLHTPRLTTPRTSIPAGSVGIGGKQTGIYPIDSPGGWRLLGRTPLKPYDSSRDPAFLYAMGEYIRFKPISREEYDAIEARVKDGTFVPEVIGHGSTSASVSKAQPSVSSNLKRSFSPSASPTLKVVKKGLQMTIQDQGRYGYQAQGFSVSGCMDRASYLLANALLGNDKNAAVIEMLFMGGSFRFEKRTFFALTGADMQPKLNGMPIPMNQKIKAKTGDELTLSQAANGRYTYLAIQGGIQVPLVLGSRSTNLKCCLGGLEGRALKEGDLLWGQSPFMTFLQKCRRIHHPLSKTSLAALLENTSCISASGGSRAAAAPADPLADPLTDPLIIRVLAGSQKERFEGKGLETFLSEIYTVSSQSDRMGYRLDGPAIEVGEGYDGVDILSDGTVLGSIQVPSSGKPILLLSDRQTTGGYAKIGTISQADLPKLVQCLPGRRLRFIPCRMEEALEAYRHLFS